MWLWRSSPGLPRARGGVPLSMNPACVLCTSSPRTRGCSPGKPTSTPEGTVFPAHAGVFPPHRTKQIILVGLPRARGGVPPEGYGASAFLESSPRTRGCSRVDLRRGFLVGVFPAHAGVFPHSQCHPFGEDGLPRARGGVPLLSAANCPIILSSPRTRGCSRMIALRVGSSVVFPAHAGVFP